MKYFRMKYEQFMMRLLKKIILVFLKNPRLEWYPEFLLETLKGE